MFRSPPVSPTENSTSTPRSFNHLNNELAKAAEIGDLEELKRAIEAGANVDSKNSEGYNILGIAVSNSQLEIIEYIVQTYPFLFLSKDDPNNLYRLAISTVDLKKLPGVFNKLLALDPEYKYLPKEFLENGKLIDIETIQKVARRWDLILRVEKNKLMERENLNSKKAASLLPVLMSTAEFMENLDKVKKQEDIAKKKAEDERVRGNPKPTKRDKQKAVECFKKTHKLLKGRIAAFDAHLKQVENEAQENLDLVKCINTEAHDVNLKASLSQKIIIFQKELKQYYKELAIWRTMEAEIRAALDTKHFDKILQVILEINIENKPLDLLDKLKAQFAELSGDISGFLEKNNHYQTTLVNIKEQKAINKQLIDGITDLTKDIETLNKQKALLITMGVLQPNRVASLMEQQVQNKRAVIEKSAVHIFDELKYLLELNIEHRKHVEALNNTKLHLKASKQSGIKNIQGKVEFMLKRASEKNVKKQRRKVDIINKMHSESSVICDWLLECGYYFKDSSAKGSKEKQLNFNDPLLDINNIASEAKRYFERFLSIKEKMLSVEKALIKEWDKEDVADLEIVKNKHNELKLKKLELIKIENDLSTRVDQVESLKNKLSKAKFDIESKLKNNQSKKQETKKTDNLSEESVKSLKSNQVKSIESKTSHLETLIEKFQKTLFGPSIEGNSETITIIEPSSPTLSSVFSVFDVEVDKTRIVESSPPLTHKKIDCTHKAKDEINQSIDNWILEAIKDFPVLSGSSRPQTAEPISSLNQAGSMIALSPNARPKTAPILSSLNNSSTITKRVASASELSALAQPFSPSYKGSDSFRPQQPLLFRSVHHNYATGVYFSRGPVANNNNAVYQRQGAPRLSSPYFHSSPSLRAKRSNP